MEEVDLARVICPLHELADPGARGFTMGEGDWPLRGFVVRRGGNVHAYVNHCPHAGFPLNWNPDYRTHYSKNPLYIYHISHPHGYYR